MAIKKKKENEVSAVLTPIRSHTTGTGQGTTGQSITQPAGQKVSTPTGQFTSPLTAQKNQALDTYLNRENFKYDINTDALYQQYKDKYIRQGQQAMQDTMGQAAGLTGGYGSSYAQNVGQQAYNQHLSQLNDIVPELYQLAYDRYQDEGQQLYQRYALLEEQEQKEYDREQDALKGWQWSQEQQEQKRQFDLNYGLDQQEYAEDKRQFDLSYELDQQKYAEDKRQFDQSHALAQSKANAETPNTYQTGYHGWLAQYQGQGKRPDPNDPTQITKYDNGSVSTGNILAMQRVIGVKEDGMWSKESQDAAGGLSADAAWAAFRKGQLQNRQSVGLGDMGDDNEKIRVMERALRTYPDGVWDSWDAEAAGGRTPEEAWELYQRGLLQNR